MKALRPLELAAVFAILLNFVGLIAWGLIRPTARYERTAFEHLEIGKRAYQDGEYEKAFAYYDDVAKNFSRSHHADRALFLAGRTAYRALGQIDVAVDRFEAYARRYPHGDYIDVTERYLKQVGGLGGVEPARRDAAIWEFIQAEKDYEKGRYYEALNRYQWLTTNFPGTGLHDESAAMMAKITAEAVRAYSASATVYSDQSE